MKKSGEVNTGPWEEIDLLKQGDSWVPNLPAKQPNPMAYPISHGNGQTLTESHLAALESLRETATPIQRAIGLAIRALPWLVPWLVICFGILYVLDDPLVPLLVFAGLTAGTIWALNQQEYRHSASGLERHKADLAHDLASQKLADGPCSGGQLIQK